jgi:hypothetical protein
MELFVQRATVVQNLVMPMLTSKDRENRVADGDLLGRRVPLNGAG